jgi:hypothetical protein
MPMHREKNYPYRAYLLRCWREMDAAPGQEPLWRFSAEEILGERRRKGFSSLRALIAFLRTELAGGEESLAGDEIQQNCTSPETLEESQAMRLYK